MKHFLTFGQGKNFIAAAKRLLSQVISWNQFDGLQMTICVRTLLTGINTPYSQRKTVEDMVIFYGNRI